MSKNSELQRLQTLERELQEWLEPRDTNSLSSEWEFGYMQAIEDVRKLMNKFKLKVR